MDIESISQVDIDQLMSFRLNHELHIKQQADVITKLLKNKSLKGDDDTAMTLFREMITQCNNYWEYAEPCLAGPASQTNVDLSKKAIITMVAFHKTAQVLEGLLQQSEPKVEYE